MKRFLLLTCIILLGNQNGFCQSVSLNWMNGTWYINQSNFPMWTSGKKTNPTFNYTTINKRVDDVVMQVLYDDVSYMKNGKTKHIKGYDMPLNSDNTSFLWKGKGVLASIHSKWTIEYVDLTNEWMLIHFEKTLFTPEGYDVISRSKTLEEAHLLIIEQKLRALGITGLMVIPQQ